MASWVRWKVVERPDRMVGAAPVVPQISEAQVCHFVARLEYKLSIILQVLQMKSHRFEILNRKKVKSD